MLHLFDYYENNFHEVVSCANSSDENMYLMDMANSSRETLSYSTVEKCICMCTENPCTTSCCFTHNYENNQWRNDSGGYYVNKQHIFAYRAHLEPSERVFNEGMSAYRLSKALRGICPQGFQDKEDIGNMTPYYKARDGEQTMDPYLWCGLVLACSPLVAFFILFRCGQSKTDDKYVSNWSALSFSKELHFARPYFVNRYHGKYQVYLTELNGYIDLDRMWNDMKPGPDADYWTRYNLAMGVDSAVSVAEIIPFGPQKVSGKSVVAALSIVDNKLVNIELNQNSRHYLRIADQIKDKRFNTIDERLNAILSALNPNNNLNGCPTSHQMI